MVYKIVRQNFLWIVLLVNLLALGGAMAYIAMRPAEFRAIGPYVGQLLAVEAVDKASKLQAQAAATPAPKPRQSTASAPPKADSAQPTQKNAVTTQTTTPSQPAARRTPPPKGATGMILPEEAAPRVQAEYVGPYMQEIDTEPPPIALYPFRVSRRLFPEDAPNDIEIELQMLNASGIHWKEATIILKSSDNGIPPQLFRVKEWRNDALAILRYRFPKRDLTRRMGNLRVVALYGDRRESPLSDRMIGERRMIADRMANQGDESVSDLLGAWNKTAQAMRSGQFTTETVKLEIEIPNSALLPEKLDVSLAESTKDRDAILQSFRLSREAGLEVQQEVIKIVEALNANGYPYIKTEEGEALLAGFRQAQNKYDAEGVAFMGKIGTNGSEDVKRLREQFEQMTDRIVFLIANVETSIQTIDPSFRF